MKTAERQDSASLAASFNGAAFTVEQMLNYAAEVIWSDAGALSGTLKLQGCNDAYEPPTGNAMYLIEDPSAHWVDISSSSIPVAGSSSFLYDVAEVGYRYYRLVYTKTAGTGTMVMKHWAKGRI